jgi:hypothetical protein
MNIQPRTRSGVFASRIPRKNMSRFEAGSLVLFLAEARKKSEIQGTMFYSI